jgi:hypothetical protein
LGGIRNTEGPKSDDENEEIYRSSSSVKCRTEIDGILREGCGRFSACPCSALTLVVIAEPPRKLQNHEVGLGWITLRGRESSHVEDFGGT